MENIKNIFRILNIGLIIHLVFIQRKETESTWAWILLLLNFPIVGFVLYVLTGQSIPKHKSLGKEELGGNLTEDNHVDIFTSGEEKFESLFADIQSAKKEIFIQYYIFKEDFLFKNFREILCKKAAEGVRVNVLYDRLGSRNVRNGIWKELQSKGIQVKCFKNSFWRTYFSTISGFNYRNHRKIIVIDKYIGYVGGFNIGKEYLGMDKRFGFWRDTHFRIVGSAVNSLRNVFLEDWGEETEGTVLNGGIGGSGVQVITSGPVSATPFIRNVYLRCISKAKDRIRIQTPYFVPDSVVLNALKVALLSGKTVELMIPCKPDHMFVYWATLYYASDLLQMGAKVYIYQKGFLHAKGIVMDEDVYCYGTANMDIRSFRLNYEINAIVYGKDEVEKMCHIFERDKLDCKELTWQEYNSSKLINRIKERISRLLSPLL